MSTRDTLTGLWREWIRTLLVILLVVGGLRSAVADWNDVPTGSMKPTILEGDRIVVNKLAYDLKVPFTTWRVARWGEPQRGDIVILRSPEDGRRLVKRVVGVGGDRIAMRNDRLEVNGRPVRTEVVGTVEPGEAGSRQRLLVMETLGRRRHAILITPELPAMRTFAPVTVPAGRLFVMGDNRDESGDSRYFGTVAVSAVSGRVTAVAASVDPERHYLPRWGRFFHGLR